MPHMAAGEVVICNKKMVAWLKLAAPGSLIRTSGVPAIKWLRFRMANLVLMYKHLMLLKVGGHLIC